MWLILFLLQLHYWLGCNVENLKCVARLNFSFRPWLDFEISQLQESKHPIPRLHRATHILCNMTLVYISSHCLYGLPLWQEPHGGLQVCVYVCYIACLWVCINVQCACLYNKYTVVYIYTLHASARVKCVLPWLLVQKVHLRVFI